MVEDVGIVLGQALNEAIGDKSGITRYGHAYVPLDEALSTGCNRPVRSSWLALWGGVHSRSRG